MKVEEIECPALHRLIGYLEAVSDFVRGGELKWYFEARLFKCDNADFDINSFIKAAYPEAKLPTATIVRGSVSDILETFEHELGKFVPQIQGLMFLTPLLSGTGALWEYMAECIDYERAQIFEYSNSEPDSLLHGILGDFAIIFYNEKMKRCLVLFGATSD